MHSFQIHCIIELLSIPLFMSCLLSQSTSIHCPPDGVGNPLTRYTTKQEKNEVNPKGEVELSNLFLNLIVKWKRAIASYSLKY